MERLWTPWRMDYIMDQKETGCPFCRALVANDDAGQYIVYRGERTFVILNRYPYNNGHLMIMPYAHVGDLSDLDEATRNEMMALLDLSVRALRETSRPQGFNMGLNLGEAAGAGVTDHLHMHVVPRWGGDTNYMTVLNEVRTIPELLDETYRRLQPVMARLAKASR
ncbi:MAG: HIT domain-containing protein [Ardenticatenaceae bacterium]|nr:HIT domain-containing protein [Ardenticatenaceae bacterium]